MRAACSSSNFNDISIIFAPSGSNFGDFDGAVACSYWDDTTQSSMATGSSQDKDRDSSHRDGDGDGVPDSSDRCLNTPNPRCYKEDT
jgi:hypothetical protein